LLQGAKIFANVRFFIERLEHFIAKESHPVRQVIVDARAIPDIDVTAGEQLRTFVALLNERGIRFVAAKAHLPLRDAAHRLGLEESFPEETRFPKLSDAVAAFER
jgi:sulfate permease, SulP family